MITVKNTFVPKAPEITLLLLAIFTIGTSTEPVRCANKIYCGGRILDTVQMARLFTDSKTFVDMKQKYDEEEILKNFDTFMKETNNKPSKDDVKKFVDENFQQEDEIEAWTPNDFQKTPKILAEIQDREVQKFTQDLINVWPKLTRKIKEAVFGEGHRYSLITKINRNGFVIPGGRFREYYYWDSYWIIRGLLLCEMTNTVKGMLDNFLATVNFYGHLPNGARHYYVGRSQPPLLTLMVYTYYKIKKDYLWLEKALPIIAKELEFWITYRAITVEKDGVHYEVFHYYSDIGLPRPESYYEDVHTASSVKNESDKKTLWTNIRSAAESGWDFSSRWIVDKEGGTEAELSSLQTQRIIPVDLNAFLCQAFRKLGELYLLNNDINKTYYWFDKASSLQLGIEKLLYHEEDGIWYDLDMKLKKPRRYFFASNFAPLWSQVYKAKDAGQLGRRAVGYLRRHKILSYHGGIPVSLSQTHQQWDFPNAWPPLQDIVIMGLYKTGNSEARKVAKQLAEVWVRANMKGFKETGNMFEKYHAEKPGMYGSGGEYVVQSGFGWTNGVIFELVNAFFTKRNNTDRVGGRNDFILWCLLICYFY